MSGLTLIVPGETPLLAVAPTILFFFMWLIIYVMMAGERLIVCQRGILLGSFAPFLQPYAIRYEQIIVGSVVPISGNIRRYHKQTGLPAFLSSVRILPDRKSTRLNSSHVAISYAVFCLKKNKLTELQSGLIGDAVAAVLISGLGYAVTTANDTDDQISTEEVQ